MVCGLGRTTSLSFQRITHSAALVAFATLLTTPQSSSFAWSLNSSPTFNTKGSSSSNSQSCRLFSTASFNAAATAAMSSDTCRPGGSGSLEVAIIPCLSDNYGYLIHDAAQGLTAAVDTPEADPYMRELEKRGWTLTHIFNTHHHSDHVGGNLELKKDGVQIYGPAKEKARIPGIDIALADGDEIEFGSVKVRILDVGGHTKGHIAYYFPSEATAFVGDSLFALGCGRMFEGTPTQFWTSLQKLRELPDDTLIYWCVMILSSICGDIDMNLGFDIVNS